MSETTYPLISNNGQHINCISHIRFVANLATRRTLRYIPSMSALSFASAYRSLRPGERAFVDGYVADVEERSIKRNERISLALNRQITAKDVEESRGMLDMPMVRAAIVERINSIAADEELSPRRVIKEMIAIGMGNMKNYLKQNQYGDWEADLDSCTPEQWAAIKSYEVDENMRGGRKVKIVLHDKGAMLLACAKFMGLQEPDSAVYRADYTKPAVAALPAGIGTDGAADAYARMING